MIIIYKNVFSHMVFSTRKEMNMSMKQAYVEKVQARLNEWDAEIEKLKARLKIPAAPPTGSTVKPISRRS